MMPQLMLGACKKQSVSTVDLVDPFGDNSGVALYKFDGDATGYGALQNFYNGTPWQQQYSFNTTQSGDIGTWSTSGSLPFSGNSSCAVYLSNIFIGGIYTTSSQTSVYKASIDSGGNIGSFTKVSDTPSASGAGRCYIIKNKLYVVSGITSGSLSHGSVYYADIDSSGNIGTFVSGNSSSHGYNHCGVTIGNRFYLFGGAAVGSGGASISTVSYATIDSNGVLSAWSSSTSLPASLQASSCAVIGNRVYIIGGYTSSNVSTVYWAYINSDFSLGSWNTGTSIPSAGQYSAVCVNKTLYLIGSSASTATYCATINQDCSLGSWVGMSNAPANFGNGFGYFIVNSRIYKLGANNAQNTIYSAPFSGGMNDYSSELVKQQPTDVSGTASNVTYTDGKFGQCAVFNGSSSKIDTGNITVGTEASWSLWVKTLSANNTTANEPIFTHGWDTATDNRIGLNCGTLHSTDIQVLLGTHGSWIATGAKKDGTWQHVVISKTISNYTIYANGVSQGTFATTANITTVLTIGRFGNSYSYFGNFEIDQFRIFNRAITQEEVTALYNEYYAPKVYTDFFSDNSEILNLKFDGDATDSSGTYDGVASGVTYTTGKIGQCAVFNGTNTYDGFTEAVSPNASFVNLSTRSIDLFSEYSGKPRTYSAWVALSSSTDAFVLNYGNLDNLTSPYYFKICFTPTIFHVRTQSFQPGNTFVGKESNTVHNKSITYGTFYHISFVFPSDSTGVIKFYINGEFVGQATHTVWSTLSSSYDVWLQKFTGNAGNGYASHYVGCKIDSLRVFNRALNSAEIINLYEEGGDTYVPYVPPQGFFNDGTEVAYYAFDGDATDSTGNYDGTATNVTYGAGKIGQCAVFNGSSSYVKIPQGVYSSNAFSVSCWVKFNALGLEQRFVVCNSNTYSKYFRVSIRTDNKISAYYGTSNSAIIISPSTYTTGVFYHIAMSAIQGSNLSLYINGVLIQSIANSGTGYVNDLANELGAWIGSGRGGATELLNGSIDQVRIFNRALTATEVTALYNEGQ